MADPPVHIIIIALLHFEFRFPTQQASATRKNTFARAPRPPGPDFSHRKIRKLLTPQHEICLPFLMKDHGRDWHKTCCRFGDGWK